MEKIKEIFNKKQRLLFISGIILLLLVILRAIFFINNDKQTYSKYKIDNIELNENTKNKIEKTDLKEQILIDYLSDFMEQYNYACKNKTAIELTSKSKSFISYHTELLKLGDMDNVLENFPNKEDYEIYRQHLLFVGEFFELSYIDADAKINKLNYDFKMLSGEEPKLIIDENYYQYLKDVKNQIDKLLKDYFK